jgi:cytochrome c551/c552
MRRGFLVGWLSILSVCLAHGQTMSPQKEAVTSTRLPAAARKAVIDQYCVGCHNQKVKVGGLALDKLDMAHVGDNAETWEKVVRKLRAGMMPPAGVAGPCHLCSAEG